MSSDKPSPSSWLRSSRPSGQLTEEQKKGEKREKIIKELVATIADAPSTGSATLFALSAAAGTCCLVKPDNPVITSVEASGNWAVAFFAFAALVAFYAAAKYLLADDAKDKLKNTYGLKDDEITGRVEGYKQAKPDSCSATDLGSFVASCLQ